MAEKRGGGVSWLLYCFGGRGYAGRGGHGKLRWRDREREWIAATMP